MFSASKDWTDLPTGTTFDAEGDASLHFGLLRGMEDLSMSFSIFFLHVAVN